MTVMTTVGSAGYTYWHHWTRFAGDTHWHLTTRPKQTRPCVYRKLILIDLNHVNPTSDVIQNREVVIVPWPTSARWLCGRATVLHNGSVRERHHARPDHIRFTIYKTIYSPVLSPRKISLPAVLPNEYVTEM